jgi:L-ascorbate metabolism protein UlaG (beta-lactamase superfamily)
MRIIEIAKIYFSKNKEFKMKIKWLGQSSFVVNSQKTLVTDPYNPLMGRLPKDLSAAVVTVSHQHPDHNYVKGVKSSPKIINQTGEYSAGGFEIKGITTDHDNEGGKKRGKNIVFVIKIDGLTLCHLGDLGQILNPDQLAQIGQVDILMIPVGGRATIGPDEAVKIVNQLKPKIVLPMHYKTKTGLSTFMFATVDKFTEALGWPVEEVAEFEIDKEKLVTTNQKVVILKK